MLENRTSNAIPAAKASSDIQLLDRLAPYAHWSLRIALASVFLYHGLTKFPNLGGMAAMMGLPVAILTLVAILEAGGGALVLIGGFTNSLITRLGAAMVIPPMLGAIAMMHWPQWPFVASDTHPMGGMEFQVTLVLVSLYLLIKGNNEK